MKRWSVTVVEKTVVGLRDGENISGELENDRTGGWMI